MVENGSQTIRVAIHGAAGQMGRRLVALGSEDPQLTIAAALERSDYPEIGCDAGTLAGIKPLGVPLTGTLPNGADVVVDFSVPEPALAICDICAQRQIPLVLATTGFNGAQQDRIREAAKQIPIVWSPSMSKAVNITMELARFAAQALQRNGDAADVEIIERHHRFKKDAPSGTAIRFGEIIAGVMRQSRHQHGRKGLTGQRPRDEIGYHAVRYGDNPGVHTIVFGLLGETIELTVSATNRDCYVAGALAAAKFLVGKPPGQYSMLDVLGLSRPKD